MASLQLQNEGSKEAQLAFLLEGSADNEGAGLGTEEAQQEHEQEDEVGDLPKAVSADGAQQKGARLVQQKTLDIMEHMRFEEEEKEKPSFMRSSTLPVEFTSQLTNQLEFEHDFQTDDQNFKIQVFDLRKPEEQKEIPLIQSVWKADVPVSGIDPLAGKLKSKLGGDKANPSVSAAQDRAFKRRNTFERHYTNEEIKTPIMVSVTAIAEEGEQEGSQDGDIPLIEDVWGKGKAGYVESGGDRMAEEAYARRQEEMKQEQDQDEKSDQLEQREERYYSPEGKRQINKRQSSMRYESLDDDKLEVMKIEVLDLREEGFDSELEETDTPLIEEIWGTRNELDDIIQRRSEEPQQGPGVAVVVERTEERKEESKEEREQEDAGEDDELGDEVEEMDNYLIFFEPKPSVPNPTRSAKQSLMRINYFDTEIQKLSLNAEDLVIEDIRFEGELPSPPNKFYKINKILKNQGDFISSHFDIPHDQSFEEPRSLPRFHDTLGTQKFELFILLLVEYSPLPNGRVALDQASFYKFYADFAEHLQITKEDATFLYNRKLHGADVLSITRCAELVEEIAVRRKEPVEGLVDELLTKCDKLGLLKKLRLISLQKSEAESSPCIRKLADTYHEQLLKVRDCEQFQVFTAYSEEGRMHSRGLVALMEGRGAVPGLLKAEEAQKVGTGIIRQLFFSGQRCDRLSGLQEEIDFGRFTRLLSVVALASYKKEAIQGKAACEKLLRLLLQDD